MNSAPPAPRESLGNWRWSRLAPAVTVGLITGVLEVILALSFAALIFSGPLATYLPNGIGLALIGAIVNGVAVALLTSAPGVVSGNQDIPAAIMGIAASSVVAGAAAADMEATFVTVVAMVGLTTILTGLFFYALARFRLGNLMRFLPYPVVGGFLAATGWLLFLGGIGIMTDLHISLENAATLFEPAGMLRWVPGVAFASVMVFLLRRVDHVLALPGVVGAGVALFYVAAALAGQGVPMLQADGWLLGPFPGQRLWHPLTFSELSLVNWEAIARQLPDMATIMALSAISLLLNSGALEAALDNDIAPNRELRAAGIANLLGGALGGLVGYQQLSLSVLNHRAAGPSRLTGLIAALTCAIVLLLGGSFMSLFPKLVLGGLLSFLGLTFLLDTIVTSWQTIPRSDYAVMILILIVAATVGFMEAIGVGLLAAVALFVVNYSRTDVVRNELTGRTLQSRVTRNPEACRRLDERGRQLAIFRLQGYIFFGTADSLVARLAERLERNEQDGISFLILDFSHVTGVDSTAISSFVKIMRLAQRKSVTLVLTAPNRTLLDQLVTRSVAGDICNIFNDLDRGLEYCEEQLLASTDLAVAGDGSLEEALAGRLNDTNKAQRLLSHFQRLDVTEGDVLMRQGDPADALFFLWTGQVSAYLEQADGGRVRLQTMRDWNMLGEIGFFLDAERTATVVAEKPGVVYRLARGSLARMRESDPDAVAALQQLTIEFLGERATHLVGVVDALRR